MKIVSCFSDPKEIPALAKAGAGELYCAIASLPAFGEPAALSGIRQLKASVRAAHDLGLRVSLAVNSLESCFARKDEARILENLSSAQEAGVDAFIAASPAMFALLSKERWRAELHLSSVQPCFNSLAAEFFVKLGVSRIILPNQLSPFEARGILRLCRARSVETEIFDYRFFGCAYVNGRCNLHWPEYYTLNASAVNGSMCRLNSSAGKSPVARVVDPDPARVPVLGAVIRRLSGRLRCGGAPRMANAAAFFDFFSAGAGYLKYGTRHDRAEIKVRKVGELRRMLGLAEQLSAELPHEKARECFIRKMEAWDGNKY